MSPTAVAVLSVCGAASCFAMATILQCIGARRVLGATTFSVRLLTGLVHQRAFVAGLLLDGAGFALTLVAVRSLPLFLVQAVSAASVGLTALLATRFLGERLSDVERLSLGAVVVGLSLLAVSAAPGEGAAFHPEHRLVLLAWLPLIALVAWLLERGRQTPAAVLGALSGLALGAGSIAARGLVMPATWEAAAGDLLVWAAVLFTAQGVLLFSVALQRGSATTVSAASMVAETLVPAAAGLLLLGDRARPGFGGLASFGVMVTLLGALGLTLGREQRMSLPVERLVRAGGREPTRSGQDRPDLAGRPALPSTCHCGAELYRRPPTVRLEEGQRATGRAPSARRLMVLSEN